MTECLQAHFSRSHLGPDLAADQKRAVPNATRLLQARGQEEAGGLGGRRAFVGRQLLACGLQAPAGLLALRGSPLRLLKRGGCEGAGGGVFVQPMMGGAPRQVCVHSPRCPLLLRLLPPVLNSKSSSFCTCET